MKKKYLLFCFFLLNLLFFPFKIMAIEPVYDKFLGENYMFVEGTATSDGGYAVVAADNEVSNMVSIIKYSKDGETEWTRYYNVPDAPEDCSRYYWQYNQETGMNERVCERIQSSLIFGFTELDNGRLVFISNYFRMLFSSDGTLISTIDMGSQFYNYFGFRCESEGEGTACAAIGGDRTTIRNIFNGNDISNEKIIGRVFTLNDDGVISNTFDIPSIPIVISDNAASIGVPISLFKNEDDNYVMQTIEAVVPWVYVFDKNLRQISKNPILILDSSINIVKQIGDVYWINGQFQNGDYFGNYVKYAGPLAKSKISYVSFNSSMTDVKNEKTIYEANLDIQRFLKYGISEEEEAQLMFKAAFLGIVGLLDGYRDGKYVSAFDMEMNGNFLDSDSNPLKSITAYFKRIDYNMEEFDKYPVLVIDEDSENGVLRGNMILYSSILRLQDGSDVVLLNLGNNGVQGARHIKFGRQLTVSAVPKSVADVSFASSVYEPGDVVAVQLRQRDGYYIDKVIVRDGTGKIIDFDQKNQTFIMPDSDVTVEVQYKKIEQVKTGVLFSTLLSLLAIGFVAFSNYSFFKRQKPIGM